MKSIFLVPYPNGVPSLPPQHAEKPGDVQLVYKDVQGVEHGGWVVMSPPKLGDPPTTVCIVDSSEEVLDAVANLPGVAFIEDVPEVVPNA